MVFVGLWVGFGVLPAERVFYLLVCVMMVSAASVMVTVVARVMVLICLCVW